MAKPAVQIYVKTARMLHLKLVIIHCIRSSSAYPKRHGCAIENGFAFYIAFRFSILFYTIGFAFLHTLLPGKIIAVNMSF
jgi:hypothetical protein